jgi:ubiquinone/menaquinone biosynthesis C-methylase UbiE
MNMNCIEKWMVNLPSTGKSGIILVQKLLSYADIGEGRKFLDIGCGRGVISRFLASEYKGKITGIDIDQNELDIASRESPGDSVKYLVADARNLPFEDRSMDVVVAFGVLHHIYDWQKAVQQVGRVLKVGGLFLTAELIYSQRLVNLDEKASYRFGIHNLDTNQLTRLLQDEGFITLHSETRKRLFWHDFEAVFEKKWEKSFSRV